MEKKVLIPSDISQPGKDYLAEKGYTIKMGRRTDEQTILAVSYTHLTLPTT